MAINYPIFNFKRSIYSASVKCKGIMGVSSRSTHLCCQRKLPHVPRVQPIQPYRYRYGLSKSYRYLYGLLGSYPYRYRKKQVLCQTWKHR